MMLACGPLRVSPSTTRALTFSWSAWWIKKLSKKESCHLFGSLFVSSSSSSSCFGDFHNSLQKEWKSSRYHRPLPMKHATISITVSFLTPFYSDFILFSSQQWSSSGAGELRIKKLHQVLCLLTHPRRTFGYYLISHAVGSTLKKSTPCEFLFPSTDLEQKFFFPRLKIF